MRARVGALEKATALPVRLAAASLVAALVATRFAGLDGLYVYNFDSPVDAYLPVAFHDALRQGRLPLWSNDLGLGFPLYAEGKIAAFYPPHWLIYQLPPLVATQVALLVHLALLGLGTGLLAFRLTGSRVSALFAAAAIPLTGAVVSKLEWTNMIEAFAWLPWVLLPILGRKRPSAARLALSGAALGVQALLGHPDIWLLTGLCIWVVRLAETPTLRSATDAVVICVIGAGLGAVQLIPTLLLLPLSTRANGLSAAEFFAYPGTWLDGLGFAFASAFVPLAKSQDLNATWFPAGGWGLLEAGGYVGLPTICLATLGLARRRARTLLALVVTCATVPMLWAFRPEWLTSLPLLDALRRPTRAYLVVDFALVLAAAIGLRAFRTTGRSSALPALAALVAIGGYIGVLLASLVAPGFWTATLAGIWPNVENPDAPVITQGVLGSPFPVLVELALAAALVGGMRTRATPQKAVVLAAALALAPMALLTPSINQHLGPEFFFPSGGTFMSALREAEPQRLVTVRAPVWYDGTPNEIALAGFNDLEVHSSMNLAAGDRLLANVRDDPDFPALARAIGIDTIVQFGAPCPGPVLSRDPESGAEFCSVPEMVRPPYWLPAHDVSLMSTRPPVGVIPEPASITTERALTDAVAPASVHISEFATDVAIDAPSSGWIFIDRSWWPSWSASIDGASVSIREAWSGQLVPVPPGHHLISVVLTFWDIWLGIATTCLTAAIVVFWLLVARSRLPASPRSRASGSPVPTRPEWTA